MKDGFLVGIIVFLCCLIPLFLIGGGLGLVAGLGTGFWILIIGSLALLVLGVIFTGGLRKRAKDKLKE